VSLHDLLRERERERSAMSEQPSPKLVATATEETASDTCCKIVSAIAREAGFKSTHQSSLYALSDVLALCTLH
jgi:hypothetical protein